MRIRFLSLVAKPDRSGTCFAVGDIADTETFLNPKGLKCLDGPRLIALGLAEEMPTERVASGEKSDDAGKRKRS
jgi:hypothetical protein